MKVLIVGLGSIASKHIEALREIDSNIELFALRSSIKSNVVEGVVDIYDNNDLCDYAFDFAIVCNPTSEHEKSIAQLSILNIPLFIEKPLYHDLSIEKLVSEVSRKNIITYIGCNLRFLDSLQFAKNYLDNNQLNINEVNIYCGSFLPEWRPTIDFRKNYSANPELGGGVHLDLIHELDYLIWFFGMPDLINKYVSSKSSLSIRAIDYANYHFEYSSFTANVVLNYYRRDAKRTFEILCDNETIFIDLIKNTVSSSSSGILYSSEQNSSEMYFDQMQYFVDCIKNNENTFNTINDGFQTLKLALK